jgi:hypothetical protein
VLVLLTERFYEMLRLYSLEVEVEVEIEVEVTLRLTVSQSVSQYVLVSGTLVGLTTRYYFLSECCCLKFAVLYLWGAAICGVITYWPESLRTRNHNLLSHLRLPQPGGPGSRIHIPRNMVAQLYPRTLGSLYVSYDS